MRMKQLEFTEFKEKMLKGEPVYYKTMKVIINNGIRHIRVAKEKKIIEVNYAFINRISENQLLFLLEWHRKRRKFTNEFDCDKATLNYCTKYLNINPEEIYILFKNYPFANAHVRMKRMFELLTISESEYRINQLKQYLYNILYKIWNRIKKLI